MVVFVVFAPVSLYIMDSVTVAMRSGSSSDTIFSTTLAGFPAPSWM